jgi:hypothetical protein
VDIVSFGLKSEFPMAFGIDICVFGSIDSHIEKHVRYGQACFRLV